MNGIYYIIDHFSIRLMDSKKQDNVEAVKTNKKTKSTDNMTLAEYHKMYYPQYYEFYHDKKSNDEVEIDAPKINTNKADQPEE